MIIFIVIGLRLSELKNVSIIICCSLNLSTKYSQKPLVSYFKASSNSISSTSVFKYSSISMSYCSFNLSAYIGFFSFLLPFFKLSFSFFSFFFFTNLLFELIIFCSLLLFISNFWGFFSSSSINLSIAGVLSPGLSSFLGGALAFCNLVESILSLVLFSLSPFLLFFISITEHWYADK